MKKFKITHYDTILRRIISEIEVDDDMEEFEVNDYLYHEGGWGKAIEKSIETVMTVHGPVPDTEIEEAE